MCTADPRRRPERASNLQALAMSERPSPIASRDRCGAALFGTSRREVTLALRAERANCRLGRPLALVLLPSAAASSSAGWCAGARAASRRRLLPVSLLAVRAPGAGTPVTPGKLSDTERKDLDSWSRARQAIDRTWRTNSPR